MEKKNNNNNNNNHSDADTTADLIARRAPDPATPRHANYQTMFRLLIA